MGEMTANVLKIDPMKSGIHTLPNYPIYLYTLYPYTLENS